MLKKCTCDQDLGKKIQRTNWDLFRFMFRRYSKFNFQDHVRKITKRHETISWRFLAKLLSGPIKDLSVYRLQYNYKIILSRYSIEINSSIFQDFRMFICSEKDKIIRNDNLLIFLFWYWFDTFNQKIEKNLQTLLKKI